MNASLRINLINPAHAKATFSFLWMTMLTANVNRFLRSFQTLHELTCSVYQMLRTGWMKGIGRGWQSWFDSSLNFDIMWLQQELCIILRYYYFWMTARGSVSHRINPPRECIVECQQVHLWPPVPACQTYIITWDSGHSSNGISFHVTENSNSHPEVMDL